MTFSFSLTKKERIGGLEISEAGILFALVFLNRADGKYAVLQYAEEPLSKGAITDGTIADSRAVIGAIKNILKKISARVPYCVLSVPTNAVYSTILSLPASLEERRTEEALRIAANFQLPFAKEESYYDTEELARGERKFFLLIAAKKAIIDPFIACATEAGIKPIAVEFHERSIARAVSSPPGISTLITSPCHSQTTAFIVKDKKLWLTQVFPNTRVQKNKVKDIARMTNFYETEYEKIGATTTISALKLTDEWNAKNALPKDARRWYAVLGAASRGALPRQSDAYPSLMAVGTKETFLYERALAFTHLFSSITTGIAIFFIAAFVGAWFFLSSIGNALLKQQGGSTLLIPPDIAETEEEVRKFSELLSLADGFIQATPRWSNVLRELQKSIPETVTIASFSVTSPTEAATMTGVAKKRGDLNKLKKRLEETAGIRNAVIPLTNLDIKENIPFTITFYFEDAALHDFE